MHGTLDFGTWWVGIGCVLDNTDETPDFFFHVDTMALPCLSYWNHVYQCVHYSRLFPALWRRARAASFTQGGGGRVLTIVLFFTTWHFGFLFLFDKARRTSPYR